MTRREYVGNAPATTLNGAITAVSATITVTDATNWPIGASFPFVVIIDRGAAAEEKVLISSRTGNVLTVNTRGFDSTTAASHADGATIEHGLSAADIDEVNDHAFDTTNDDHTQYLNNVRHDVEARHTFGAGLGTAGTPTGIAGTASAGSGANPAREDHVHLGGTLGYAQTIVSQTGISSNVDLTSLSVTVTVGTARRIKITGQVDVIQQTSGATPIGRIQEGAVTLQLFGRSTLVTGGRTIWYGSHIATPSAGAHTYKLTAESAAGTVETSVSATDPAYILVEDIGAA